MDEAGRLVHTPAVYCDAVVPIHYWSAYGFGKPRDPDIPGPPGWQRALRALFRAERRMPEMSRVREMALWSKLWLVTTPLALLEVANTFIRAQLKSLAVEELGMPAVEGRGHKDMGDLLLQLSMIAGGLKPAPEGTPQDAFTDLWQHIGVDFNWASVHELDGILLAGVMNFTLAVDAVYASPLDLAYLQLGGADIMHVLFAHHLGCKYLASFDQDFKTARDRLRDVFNLTVLSSPNELLQALERGN